jgi:hypothetical protein
MTPTAPVPHSMDDLIAHVARLYPRFPVHVVGSGGCGRLIRIGNIFLLATNELFGVQIGLGAELQGPFYYKFSMDVETGLQLFLDAAKQGLDNV